MPLFCKSIKWSCCVRMVRWVAVFAFSLFLLVLTWLAEDKINLTVVYFLLLFCLFFCIFLSFVM